MKTKAAIPNSILFLLDPGTKKIRIPTYQDSALVAFNEYCVSVGTLPAADGETTVSLGKSHEHEGTELQKVFAGRILTPTNRVAVVTSENTCLLQAQVPEKTCSIEIWANDSIVPSELFIKY